MASSSTSKQPLIAATSFSGGRTSAKRVKPRMSANRMVTGRRSPSTAGPISRLRAARVCAMVIAGRSIVVDAGVPKNSVPHDAIPHHTVPHDSVPQHAVPHDLVPEDAVPHDLVPEDAVPHDLVQ